MTRWQVFSDGLTITGVGMGLVFLTLGLIALVIWVLSKVFVAKPEAEGEEEEEEMAAPELTVAEVSTPAAEDDATAMVAAIAVALARQANQAQATPAALAGVMRVAAAFPWQALTEVDDEEITGEVVQVASITGSASWKARGRLDGLK